MSSWERLQQGERGKDAVMKTFHHRLGPLTCFSRLKQLAGCAGAGSQQQGPAPVTATSPSADTRAGVKVTGDSRSPEHGGTSAKGSAS